MAKVVQFLEDDDIINPHDYMRPLLRRADQVETEMEWLSVSEYGQPCDFLLWAPVYLMLGTVWWGSTIGKFRSTSMYVRPYEHVRGYIPLDRQLTGKQWDIRHPMYYRENESKLNEALDKVCNFGTHKGLTYRKIKERYTDYFQWMLQEVSNYDVYQIKEWIHLETAKIWDNADEYLKFEEPRDLSSVLNI